MTGDVELARIKRAAPKTAAAVQRKRIRDRKKLAQLQPRVVGEELLRDSFTRAKGI